MQGTRLVTAIVGAATAMAVAVAISAQMLDSTAIGAFRWRNVGPSNFMGRLSDVQGIPSPSKTIYVAAASGGVWTSVNNGQTWRPLMDDKEVSSMGMLAIAPTDTNIVWAGTGALVFAFFLAAGVLAMPGKLPLLIECRLASRSLGSPDEVDCVLHRAFMKEIRRRHNNLHIVHSLLGVGASWLLFHVVVLLWIVPSFSKERCRRGGGGIGWWRSLRLVQRSHDRRWRAGGDHAMGDDSTATQVAQAASLFAGEAWFDPIEAGIRDRVRGFIEELLEQELT